MSIILGTASRLLGEIETTVVAIVIVLGFLVPVAMTWHRYAAPRIRRLRQWRSLETPRLPLPPARRAR